MIGHYLISRPIEGGYVHAYVISPPPVPFEGIYATMEENVEKQGWRLGILPLVLATGPRIDRKTIRRLEDYLCGKDHAVKEALKAKKDFHMTMWVMPGDDPDLEWLMEIH